MRRDLPLMWGVAVLEQIDALPRAQLHSPLCDRDAEAHGQHSSFDMGGHVVRPFHHMREVWHLRIIGRRHQPGEIGAEVALDVRVGIFLY